MEAIPHIYCSHMGAPAVRTRTYTTRSVHGTNARCICSVYPIYYHYYTIPYITYTRLDMSPARPIKTRKNYVSYHMFCAPAMNMPAYLVYYCYEHAWSTWSNLVTTLVSSYSRSLVTLVTPIPGQTAS